MTRAKAVKALAEAYEPQKQFPNVEFGPVQRMSEPPHDFDNPPGVIDAPFEEEEIVEPHVQETFVPKKKGRRKPETVCLSPAVGPPGKPSWEITVTQDELARLIFDGGKSRRRAAWKHAEIEGEFDGHPLGDEEQRRFQGVLDRMWARGELPEGKLIEDLGDLSEQQLWRGIAEERAASVFRAAKLRK